MIITDIKLGMIEVPLRVPFKTAVRTVEKVEDIIVEIHTDTGNIGYGEAPPTGLVTGETHGSIIGAMRDFIIPVLKGREIDDFQNLIFSLHNSIRGNTSAKAVADMALWDLYGQLYNAPVYKLLGGSRKTLTTDITISVNSPEVMAEDAENAVRRGFDTLKVKVGISPEMDIKRLLSIKKAAPECSVRIDANQAWTPKQAVSILNEIKDKGINIDFVEQPVKDTDLKGLKFVTDRSPFPVLADEAVFSPQDAVNILTTGSADMVNIKLMKCGGIYKALQIADAAEIMGSQCMIGCMLEAKVSVNAAVHVACARNVITKIDLDGPVLCSEDPVKGGAVFNEKEITVSDAPGLGIEGIEGIRYLK